MDVGSVAKFLPLPRYSHDAVLHEVAARVRQQRLGGSVGQVKVHGRR